MNDQQIAEIYQPLFNHMTDEHGIILTVTEMDEIIKLAQKVTEQYNNVIARQRDEIKCKICGQPFENRVMLYFHVDEKHNQGA